MLPPEIQRIVLLISLAAVGYLLILAWTEDMEAAKAPIVYSDSPVLSQQALAAQSDRPVVDEFAPVDSDIAPMPQAAVRQPAAGKGRLVKVEPSLQIITIKAGEGISEKRQYVLSN